MIFALKCLGTSELRFLSRDKSLGHYDPAATSHIVEMQQSLPTCHIGPPNSSGVCLTAPAAGKKVTIFRVARLQNEIAVTIANSEGAEGVSEIQLRGPESAHFRNPQLRNLCFRNPYLRNPCFRNPWFRNSQTSESLPDSLVSEFPPSEFQSNSGTP